jgi:hypothetical protein
MKLIVENDTNKNNSLEEEDEDIDSKVFDNVW